MQIPFLTSGNAGVGPLMPADKNDRFVLKNCLTYMQRHLKRFPTSGRETCKMLVWVLGPDTVPVVDLMLDQFEENRRQQYKNDLQESDQDADDYAEIMAKMLPRIKSTRRRKLIGQIWSLLDKKRKSLTFRGKADFEKNIAAVQKMFSLTDLEIEFVAFLFINSIYEVPREFFVNHLECQKMIGHKYLANLLGITKARLFELLNGNLRRIGILELDSYDLKIEDDFLSLFQHPDDNKYSENFYSKIEPGEVPLDNFFFKKEQINHALKLLEKKTDTSTHILLYGPPGTGKTSFARSLLGDLSVPAYEIVRGDENTASKRRSAIMACLNMTNTGDGSLLFVDEADNILNTENSWLSRGETQDKGWLNELLETPGVRIIWITNSIAGIESSVLRRFAFSLHFRMFNRHQRIQLWNNIVGQNRCKRFFKPSDIEVLAGKYNLSAGVIDLAVKKSKEITVTSKANFQQTVEIALESHETLLHYGDKPRKKDKVESGYSLDGLNLNGDINAIIRQLKVFDSHLRETDVDTVMNMNLLFYGPPGTGKSELARYIGHELDRETHCKRISDLQSMYVGEGEKNIKQAFAEAESEDAILIIDEADSVLFSRDLAVRSWETSFTNEFLTQMEHFRGILICTTNRLADLDSAAFRRLNHKIGFDYLTPGGNLVFYRLFLESLAGESLDRAVERQIKKMSNLAPGDFKVVRDRHLFFPGDDLGHTVLIKALEHEANLKNIERKKRSIGF